MAVQQEHAPRRYQIEINFIRTDGQSLVAIPQDSALSGGFIDDDERSLALGSFHYFDAARFDAFGSQRLDLKLPKVIRADTAYISRAHSKPRKRNHCRSRLASGRERVREEGDLGVEFGKARDDYEMIDGIQPERNRIEGLAMR